MQYTRNVAATVVAIFGVATSVSADVTPKLTRATYEAAAGSKGVVLLAIRWDRWWGCGGYDNAQLRVIAFDKLPSSKLEQDSPDILLDDAPRLMTKPLFDDYALLVDPGEYGLSGFLVKVAKSVNDIDYYGARRSDLIKDGKSLGGSFSVAADEIVYVGNFYLDCYEEPIVWRYYTEDRESFAKHMAEFKAKFPFLDTTKAAYRLFETESFGRHYELP